jgi:hypothetical protein
MVKTVLGQIDLASDTTRDWSLLIDRSSARFTLRRVASSPIHMRIAATFGELQIRNDRIAGIALAFDLSSVRPIVDEQHETVPFPTCAGALRDSRVLFRGVEEGELDGRTTGLLGDLFLLGRTCRLHVATHPRPAHRSSTDQPFALSLAACIPAVSIGLPSLQRTAYGWVRWDDTEVRIETTWAPRPQSADGFRHRQRYLAS